MARQKPGGPNGVVVVDKPSGPTSHDLVAQARRAYQTRAVGHAGTLDPMASGVLLLLLGEGTKLSNYLTQAVKRYRATIEFGASTDTLDAEGAETERAAVTPEQLSRACIEAALERELARTEQEPPAFSAIKVQGQRAHRISRGGGVVRLDPRPITVHDLKLVELVFPRCVVDLAVSKGYYVRSFARDIATHLGVPGHLQALRRLASGCFTIDESHAWPSDPPPAPIPLARAAARALPVAQLTDEGETKATRGQLLGVADFDTSPEPRLSAWLNGDGELIALGQEREKGGFAVVRGFVRS